MAKSMISMNRNYLDMFSNHNLNKSYTLNSDNTIGKHSFSQPLIGIIDAGFSANYPALDYSRIQLGSDYIDNDNNLLTSDENGYEHGTQILKIIGATQGNDNGIDSLNYVNYLK